MTKTDKQQKQEDLLAVDMASYAKGAVPSDAEMAAAPLIEGWFVTIVRPRAVDTLRVKGRLHRSDLVPEPGCPFFSAPVIWFDRHHRFIRTATNLYQLGRQIGQKEAA
jgi:hypothetical protein